MNTKKLMIIFTTLILTATLTGCYDKGNARLIKALAKDKPVAIAFISESGKFVVLDAVSGKVVPPCPRPKTDDFPACKKLFKAPSHTIVSHSDTMTKKKHSEIGPRSDIIFSTNDKLKIKSQFVIEMIDWTGSYCRTYINRISGEEYQRCHGNE